MTTLCYCECQDYNTFMFKLYPYYVQPSYVHIMIKKMSKLYPLGTKSTKKYNCEDENISFYFLWTKIKFSYIYRDAKII